ncbi:putative phosphoric monoester hydrolase [Austwickia sp. TVS 96-490-7B]|uniref:SixA phosphatase family protein n=1 Tax=Austwickia sp. TVS 96-490-7B TaxID=2830843 RepID=UPI001C5A3190|nr:histidine phosphatase family protein [Austwickia sp. TVS 96-490-7B]MBW3085852.1 putative phosphoric monoester hydrolase [Austwickia sp. TVS 96-490-7B]
MTDSPRMVVLVRHAQAKNRSEGGDRERELTRHGRETARAVGEWMAQQGVRADVMVCSPAVRTVSTCDELQRGGLQVGQVWADRCLYDADPDEVIASIREVPDEVRTLVVVGHAPGVPGVVAQVADHTGRGVGEVHDEVMGWPTAGVGVVVHEGSWAVFPDETSALVMVRFP